MAILRRSSGTVSIGDSGAGALVSDEGSIDWLLPCLVVASITANVSLLLLGS